MRFIESAAHIGASREQQPMQNERGSAARRRTTGVQSVARGRSGQTQPARVAGGAPSLPMRAATTPHVLSTPSTPSTASVPSTGMSEMTSTVDDEPTIIATTHETQETPPAAEESGETVETPATAVETPHTDEVNAAAPPAAAPAVMPTITTPVSAGEPEPVNPPQQSQQSPQPAQEQLQQGQPAHAAPLPAGGAAATTTRRSASTESTESSIDACALAGGGLLGHDDAQHQHQHRRWRELSFLVGLRPARLFQRTQQSVCALPRAAIRHPDEHPDGLRCLRCHLRRHHQ